jgi:hypothetical protein
MRNLRLDMTGLLCGWLGCVLILGFNSGTFLGLILAFIFIQLWNKYVYNPTPEQMIERYLTSNPDAIKILRYLKEPKNMSFPSAIANTLNLPRREVDLHLLIMVRLGLISRTIELGKR